MGITSSPTESWEGDKMKGSALDKKYQIEDAARILVRAEEIKQDDELYSAAMKEIKKQQDALEQVLWNERFPTMKK